MEPILKKPRTMQTHPINEDRLSYGEYHHLFGALKLNPKKFKEYLRMRIDTFTYILSKVEQSLSKNWCNLHNRPILPEERLVLTLRFLATGSSYTELHFAFRMGVSTVSKIIKETLNALWNNLQPLHMPIPTEKDFLKISEDFYKKWQFPNCIGAIDCTHIPITQPAHSGSKYFCYKKYFSIILQAFTDANYKYIAIEVGGCGSQNDAGTFKASTLYKCLVQNKLKIPKERELPNSDLVLPFVIVGDGAYPIMENLMKPFSGQNLSREQQIFNRRLSRARVVVENTFGQTKKKWSVLETTIDTSLEVTKLIVKCACLLQNVIIDLEKKVTEENVTNLSTSNSNIRSIDQTNSNENNFVHGLGKEVREDFMEYFLMNPLRK